MKFQYTNFGSYFENPKYRSCIIGRISHLLFLAILLSGCVTHQSRPTPTGNLAPELSRIEISRPSKIGGSALKYGILDNNESVGKVANGGTIVYDRKPGQMSLRSTGGWKYQYPVNKICLPGMTYKFFLDGWDGSISAGSIEEGSVKFIRVPIVTQGGSARVIGNGTFLGFTPLELKFKPEALVGEKGQAVANFEFIPTSGSEQGLGLKIQGGTESSGQVVAEDPFNNSIAEKTGVIAGDIILAINSHGISGRASVLEAEEKLVATGNIVLEILRNGQSKTLTYRVEENQTRFPLVRKFWSTKFSEFLETSTGILLDLRSYSVQNIDSENDLKPKVSSTGTGFFVSTNGYIITANHVINDASNIKVRLESGDWLDAQVHKQSKILDLAVLKVDFVPEISLSFPDFEKVAQGQKVYTLGFPVAGILGEQAKYTDGAISALSGVEDDETLLQITVPIQPGNSGGPLVDLNGKVVGVITSTARVSSFLRASGALPQNVNWAVKSQFLHTILPNELSNDHNTISKPVHQVKRCIVLIKCES